MSRRWILPLGCGLLLLLLIIGGGALVWMSGSFADILAPELRSPEGAERQNIQVQATSGRPGQPQGQIPATLTPAPAPAVTAAPAGGAGQGTENLPATTTASADVFRAVYEGSNPGVVSIQVNVESQGQVGQGAGSGFVIDSDGHIVTNNHVVAGANRMTVVFWNGFEAEAELVGRDPDSDLAVIRVDGLPEDVHMLPIADSDQVQVGDWVVAIGNPFGLGNSMTAGVVSALSRVIATQVTPFSIPHAIQTDAAINPGNSGGPLLNMQGQVIGVNAQIATGGAPANAGVGFAIPSNVVRLVVPALIEQGAYQWPWLGVEGGPVNLLVASANGLENQQGAYIHGVVDGSPAEQAGLQGSTGVDRVDGLPVPVGGDVIVQADGMQVNNFNDLLSYVAFKRPGDVVELTVIRGGDAANPTQVSVELAPRPQGVEADSEQQTLP